MEVFFLAQYDGSIRINTQIDTKNASSQMIGLANQIQKTSDKIASLRSKMDALKDVQIPTQEYAEIQKQIEATEKKINDLMARQEKFLETGGKESSSTYQRMQYDLEELRSSLPYLKGELQDLAESGKAFTLGSDTEKYAEMSAQIQQLNQQMQADTDRQAELQTQIAEREEHLAQIKANSTVSDQEIINLLEQRKQLMQEIADMEQAGVGLGHAEYEDAIVELSEIEEEIKDYKNSLAEVPEKFSFMRSAARKAFNAIRSGFSTSEKIGKQAFSGILNTARKAFSAITRGSNQSNASMSSGLKTILKYSLGIRSLYILVNKLRAAIKEGFKNLAQYSAPVNESISMLMSSLTQLKNSLATAFAPILTTVAPILTSFINMLSKAATYVGMLIATLTGQKTFVKAKKVQEDYAASLNSTASAAKKAAGALAKFDDLDVLQKQGTSGGGAGGVFVGNMFEDAEIEKGVINLADVFRKVFSSLFDPLKFAWDSVGNPAVESWKGALYEISSLTKDIGRDFMTMWSQENTVKIFENVLEIIRNIGSSAKNLVKNFSKAWNNNRIGFTIFEKIRDIFGTIVEKIKKISIATVEWSEKIDFYPLLESISHLLSSIEPIVDAVFGGLEWAWENVLLPLSGWVIEDALPAALDAIGGALELISKVAEKAAPWLKDIWENFLEPVAGFIGDAIVAFLETLGKVLYDVANNETAVSVLTGAAIAIGSIVAAIKAFNIAAGLTKIILGAIKAHPIVAAISAIIAIIALAITYWDDIKAAIQSFWDKCVEIFSNIGSWFAEKFDQVKTAVLAIWNPIKKGIKKVWDDIKGIINGVIDFIVGVFTLDWEKAWDGVTEIFKGVASVIESIIDGIISAINLVLDAINSLTGTVAGSIVKQLESTQGISVNSTVSSQNLRSLDIPALASGAVIRGGNPFMAILGDQPAGKMNIEAPADLIRDMARQGIREELSNMNLERIGGGSLQVVLSVNGEDLAQATLNNFLSEMSRQGYDVSVLGVN